MARSATYSAASMCLASVWLWPEHPLSCNNSKNCMLLHAGTTPSTGTRPPPSLPPTTRVRRQPSRCMQRCILCCWGLCFRSASMQARNGLETAVLFGHLRRELLAGRQPLRPPPVPVQLQVGCRWAGNNCNCLRHLLEVTGSPMHAPPNNLDSLQAVSLAVAGSLPQIHQSPEHPCPSHQAQVALAVPRH